MSITHNIERKKPLKKLCKYQNRTVPLNVTYIQIRQDYKIVKIVKILIFRPLSREHFQIK